MELVALSFYRVHRLTAAGDTPSRPAIARTLIPPFRIALACATPSGVARR